MSLREHPHKRITLPFMFAEMLLNLSYHVVPHKKELPPIKVTTPILYLNYSSASGSGVGAGLWSTISLISVFPYSFCISTTA